MYRRTGITVITALLLIGGFSLADAFADKKGGETANQRSLQGSVTDKQDNPINGAVVYIKNNNTLQIRSFITKEAGTYQFQSLSTDVDYEVHAESNGMTTQKKTLSSFDSRKQAVINLKMK